MKLENKVALITGAGSGIGAAVAKLFTKLGATVALFSRTEHNLLEVVSECEKLNCGQPKPKIFVGNVTDTELCKKAVEDTVKAFGKLDILVNNAGTGKEASLLSSPIEEYDEIFNINVRSVIVLTKYAAPHLINSKGCVINVSSITGHRVAASRIFYGMSKASLNHFTRYAAEELGKYQVRVNSVSPGVTKTRFPLNYGLSNEEVKKYYDGLDTMQALQRCGEPGEIANVIAFLASDESSFVTGEDIVIDGGALIKPINIATKQSP